MSLIRISTPWQRYFCGAGMAALALVLTSCAEVDDTTGSRLTLPPAGSAPREPIDANDIAIVGQQTADAILALPAVEDASSPPLVQFTGVTSIVSGPVQVDTEPYTELLRDRVLLQTRLKLRFIEQTLPPLVLAKKGKRHAPAAAAETPTDADYQLLAELRGRYDDPLYRVEVQFVDAHSGEVLFDGLYRIRKEAGMEGNGDTPPVVAPPPEMGTGGVQ